MRAKPLLMLPLLAACGQEVTVTKGIPILATPPEVLDFGEVNVGQEATLTWKMQNGGIADMNLLTAELIGDEPQLYTVEIPDIVPAHGEAELRIGYRPDAETSHSGVLALTTDDPSHESLNIKVGGIGVVARLEITPQSLWFGSVDMGDSYTQSTTLSSTGSGTLEITDIQFPGAEALAYFYQLPDDFESLPITIDPGHAIQLDVTYAPTFDEDISGSMVLVTNDIDSAYQTVSLLAGDGEGGTEPPECEILSPAWGTRWVEGSPVYLSAHAVDPDAPPTTLFVTVRVDGTPQPQVGIPDKSGTVMWSGGGDTVGLTGIDAGEHTIEISCMDTDDHVTKAAVDISVDPEDQLEYVINGGESVFQYFEVDDDITLYVNGTAVLVDDDRSSGLGGLPIAPAAFVAEKGDDIRITMRDEKACIRGNTELWLHFGTEHHLKLADATSLSGNANGADGGDDCGSRDDYDPDAYQTPPYTFYDETFTISIP